VKSFFTFLKIFVHEPFYIEILATMESKSGKLLAQVQKLTD